MAYAVRFHGWLALPTSRATGVPQPLCCSDRFDASQQCGFDNTRLNFGIHIRMGDRRQFVSTDLEYFRLLDAFMNTVTAQVQALGLPPPIFHVFSETSRPCPSRDTGVFEEFSAWPPVEWSQVRQGIERGGGLRGAEISHLTIFVISEACFTVNAPAFPLVCQGQRKH